MSVQGTTGVIAQPDAGTGDTRSITTTKTWVGTHAEANAQFATYRSSGWQVSLQPISGSPMSIITATIRNDLDSVISIWELDVQWQKVDFEESQVFNAYLDGLASDTARAAKIAELQDATDEVVKSYATTKFTALSATDKLYCLSMIRNDAIDEPAAVLRRINQYKSTTTNYADWTDVNKVWTTTQLTTAAGSHTIPSAIVGTLPSTYYWLKTSGGVQFGQDGSFTVVTHWVAGRYPSHLYTYKT